MKRMATTVTVVCLAFFLSGCGKSQPAGGDASGDAAVKTAPPTVSLGSGSSEPDDGSTNPFEEEDGQSSSSKTPQPANGIAPKEKEQKKPAAKNSGETSPAPFKQTTK